MTFLSWAAEPEHDERKLMGAKWMAVLSVVRPRRAPGLRNCLRCRPPGGASRSSPRRRMRRAAAPQKLSLAASHDLPASSTQVFLTTIYYKRWKWSPLKSRRIVVDVVN